MLTRQTNEEKILQSKIAGTRNYFKIIIGFNRISGCSKLSSFLMSKNLTIIQSPVISRVLQQFLEISTKYWGLAIVSGTFRGILVRVWHGCQIKGVKTNDFCFE